MNEARHRRNAIAYSYDVSFCWAKNALFSKRARTEFIFYRTRVTRTVRPARRNRLLQKLRTMPIYDACPQVIPARRSIDGFELRHTSAIRTLSEGSSFGSVTKIPCVSGRWEAIVYAFLKVNRNAFVMSDPRFSYFSVHARIFSPPHHNLFSPLVLVALTPELSIRQDSSYIYSSTAFVM